METTRQLKLLDGTLAAADAARVLLALVQSKMDFHRLEKISNEERFGRDLAHSQRRLAELARVREEIQAVCRSAADKGQPLKLNGWIEITAVEV